MTAKVLSESPHESGGKTYEVEAGSVALVVEFMTGDASAGEQAFIADISFVVAERTLSGEGTNHRSAFLAAVSRYDVNVRSGIPLPAIAWADVTHALEAIGAF